jgi:hypothetical protein
MHDTQQFLCSNPVPLCHVVPGPLDSTQTQAQNKTNKHKQTQTNTNKHKHTHDHNLAHDALERRLVDEQVSGLLVVADLPACMLMVVGVVAVMLPLLSCCRCSLFTVHCHVHWQVHWHVRDRGCTVRYMDRLA